MKAFRSRVHVLLSRIYSWYLEWNGTIRWLPCPWKVFRECRQNFSLKNLTVDDVTAELWTKFATGPVEGNEGTLFKSIGDRYPGQKFFLHSDPHAVTVRYKDTIFGCMIQQWTTLSLHCRCAPSWTLLCCIWWQTGKLKFLFLVFFYFNCVFADEQFLF